MLTLLPPREAHALPGFVSHRPRVPAAVGIVGVGNSGRALAAWLASHGQQVHLLTRDLRRLPQLRSSRRLGASGRLGQHDDRVRHGTKVAVLWSDSRDGPDPADAMGENLYLAMSQDDGVHFSSPRRLTDGEVPRACPCCRPSAEFVGGSLYVAYRATQRNCKDIHVLSVDTSGAVTDRAISHQSWELVGCPHDGPSMDLYGPSWQVCWTSHDRMYSSVSRDAGTTWSAPRDEGDADRHQIVGHRLYRREDETHWASGRIVNVVLEPGTWSTGADGRVVWVEADAR